MEALLVKYGYILVFLGVAVEGEAALLAAALLAHRGVLSLPIVILVAVAANSLADQVYYLAARARGRAWLERRFGANAHYARLLNSMGRHAPWLLVVSRYAYGLRILIPAACGVLGMRLRVFIPLDLLAGVAWAVPMAFVGYYASLALETILTKLRHHELLLALLAILVPAAWLALRRLHRILPSRDMRWSDLHALVPFVMGLMGVLNLVSGMWPRSAVAVRVLERWLPLEVMQGSRPLMIFAGLALLQVTRNLGRRKTLAWWVAVCALGISFLSHVGRAVDLQHSGVAGLLLSYLIVFRRRFNARSDPASLQHGLLMVPVLAVTVLAYGILGLDSLHAQFTWQPGATPLQAAFWSGIAIVDGPLSPRSPHAARFLESLQVAGWLARFYMLVLILRPVVLRDRLDAPAELVARLFAAHGRKSLAAFAVLPDKHHQVLAGGGGLVAYATRGSVTLACGDPLAPDELFEQGVREYLAHCRRQGWTPCIYEAAAERLPVYRRLGLRALKMAEEAIVDLPSFSLAGGKRAALRSMVHKVQRTGVVVTPYRRAEACDADVDEQLEEISEEWLTEKRAGEMSFTLGRFSLEGLDGAHVFLLRSEQRVVAFCSWIPYRNGQAAVLDLMRKRKDAVSGAMDLLLAEALASLKTTGLTEASLANAPLANTGDPRTPLDRGVALLFERLNAFYGYKNLFQFKKKFAPRWEARYLVYPRNADLPRVAYAMTALHTSRRDLFGLLFSR